MIKYALLIRRYMDELQDKAIKLGFTQLEMLEEMERDYSRKMKKLYKRLEREYGFDKQKFYALQDQAVML